jgi:hypothetical protein
MSGFPLPALDVKPTVAPPDPLAEFGRVAQLRSQIQQQQAQQQEMQIRGQAIKDQQATTAAMNQWDPSSGDYDKLAKSVLDNGGSANAATAIQQHGLQVKQSLSTLDKDQRENFIANRKVVGDTLGELKDVPDEQLHDQALQTVNQLVQRRIFDPAQAQGLQQKILSTSDPTQLRQLIDQSAKMNEGLAGVAAQAKTEAETKHAAAQTAESQQKTIEAAANTAKTQVETQNMQQGLTPALMEARYIRLQALKSQGHALNADDAAFVKGYEKNKTLVPVANFNLQNSGAAADNNGNPSQIAQALAENRMKWSEAVSPRTPQSTKNAIMAQVYKINPNYDTSEFGLESDAAKKARSGAWADTRIAYNTAIDHADQLLTASKALQNGDVQKLNQLKNYFSTQFGSPDATTAQAIANAYNHEVTSVVAKGHMTDAEVAQGHGVLDVNKSSPEQIAGVAQAYKNLMSSKRDELDKIIKAGAGNKANGVVNVESKGGDFFSNFGGKKR